MANYKPDPAPEAGPGWYMSDETPIARHEFTEANQLHLFPFGEDDTPRLDCPDGCGAFCEPGSLGEAVDWALSHKCSLERGAPGTTAATTAREKAPGA